MFNFSIKSSRGRLQVDLLPPSTISYWVDKLQSPGLQTLYDFGPFLSALLDLLAEVVGHVPLEGLRSLLEARFFIVSSQLFLDLQLPLQLLIANLKS